MAQAETTMTGRRRRRFVEGRRHQVGSSPVTVLVVLALVGSTAVAAAPGPASAVDPQPSTSSADASIPVVSGFDHTGAKIDLPYFDGPQGPVITLRQTDPVRVVDATPRLVWPEQERVDEGLLPATTSSYDRIHCVDDEVWPRQTLATSACFTRAINLAASSRGTWFVDVPLTVTSPAGPLIFDRWEQSAAVIAGSARCRTGDQGVYDVPWGANATGQTSNPAAFPTAAQFRLWMDATTRAGYGAEVEAHYALAATGTPDTTAPLVSVISPIDCYWYPQGAVVPALFDCRELGLGVGLNGTGVASCVTTNGAGQVAPGAPIDTSTAGDKTLTVTATDTAGNSRSRTIRYRVDGAAPEVAIATTPAEPNDAGWFSAAELEVGGTLPLSAAATDEAGGSSIGRFACTVGGVETRAVRSFGGGLFAEPPPVVYTANDIDYALGAGDHTVDCAVTDRSGQTATATRSVRVDSQPPAQAGFYGPTAPFPGRCPAINDFGTYEPVYQGFRYPVQYLGGADVGSGLVVPGAGWMDLDVSTPGLTTVYAPTMIDRAGNESPGGACTYFVLATAAMLSEFGPPVSMDAVNVAKAGRTIPFKFSVTRAGVPVTGLTSAVTSITRYACDATAPTDALDLVGTSGSSKLIDLGGGHYQYNVQSVRSWARGCFHLGVTVDGATMTARFAFTR